MWSTQDDLATMIKEENLRSAGNWFWAGPGRGQPLPSLAWCVEESLRLRVLFRRWCPVALCSVCCPNVCAEEKLQLFPGQPDPPLLTGVPNMPEVCVVSAPEGCGLKFLYFKSCPYWWQKGRKKQMLKDPQMRAAGQTCATCQASWPRRTRVCSLGGWLYPGWGRQSHRHRLPHYKTSRPLRLQKNDDSLPGMG